MRLLTKKEAADRARVHPESLMRWTREGVAPRPVKIGGKRGSAVRFIEDEIDAWLAASKVAERDAINSEAV
jgi:predicted DNA-binding transcriptional regulator AlpA